MTATMFVSSPMGRLGVGRPIKVIKHRKFSPNLYLFVVMGSEHDRGLIPRICESMFLKMAEGTTYKVEVSYLEIYNERVKDLLKKNSSHNLKVREHPSQGPYVQVFNIANVYAVKKLNYSNRRTYLGI